jgi:hypothetical protein
MNTQSFYSLLGPMGSDSTIASGVFYNALERKELFYSYRRVEQTVSQALVQATSAFKYVSLFLPYPSLACT